VERRAEVAAAAATAGTAVETVAVAIATAADSADAVLLAEEVAAEEDPLHPVETLMDRLVTETGVVRNRRAAT